LRFKSATSSFRNLLVVVEHHCTFWLATSSINLQLVFNACSWSLASK
jgi:hypothetical protein